ncbi:MAG: alpha/beta hydrolase [bacterium]|nr:alpha/beta hydrolase [bacterium]
MKSTRQAPPGKDRGLRRGFAMLATLSIFALSAGACDKTNPPQPGEIRTVKFKSEGATLVGNLHYPANYRPGERYPAIIVTGSWTTVKEQMPALYAQKFAREKDLIALTFDFRNYGASEGEPRFYESPRLKIEDIQNAAAYLASVNAVDPKRVGGFAVCASAGYLLEAAAAAPERIQAIATAASWLHDAEAVKLFYGGEAGVQKRIAAARQAKAKYEASGEVEYIPTISASDESAAMYGPFDYYLNPERGAIAEWSADKFAVMSWEDWLSYDPMPSARRLQTPVLMIHSDGAVLPDYAKKYFAAIQSDHKKLHWISSGAQPPFEQFDFYDDPQKTQLSVDLAADWFAIHL